MSHMCFNHRGVALPIALATLALCMTAVVTLASMASSAKLVRSADRSTQLANDLLVAAESPILHWLSTESTAAVLPEYAFSPHVDIMHDLWSIDGIEHELLITAWDQCGMVPIQALRSGSSLRLAVPDHVLQVLDEAFAHANGTGNLEFDWSGLDSLASVLEPEDRTAMYPQGGESKLITFGDGAVGTSRLKTGTPGEPGVPGVPGASGGSGGGAFVATHQSPPLQRGNPPIVINVNTAPMSLVRAALREAGRGGWEQIAAARASGASTNSSSLPAVAAVSERTINLVGSSSAWAFRIDVRVGSIVRSWWSVYVMSPASDAGWECVQRHVIDS